MSSPQPLPCPNPACGAPAGKAISDGRYNCGNHACPLHFGAWTLAQWNAWPRRPDTAEEQSLAEVLADHLVTCDDQIARHEDTIRRLRNANRSPEGMAEELERAHACIEAEAERQRPSASAEALAEEFDAAAAECDLPGYGDPTIAAVEFRDWAARVRALSSPDAALVEALEWIADPPGFKAKFDPQEPGPEPEHWVGAMRGVARRALAATKGGKA